MDLLKRLEDNENYQWAKSIGAFFSTRASQRALFKKAGHIGVHAAFIAAKKCIYLLIRSHRIAGRNQGGHFKRVLRQEDKERDFFFIQAYIHSKKCILKLLTCTYIFFPSSLIVWMDLQKQRNNLNINDYLSCVCFLIFRNSALFPPFTHSNPWILKKKNHLDVDEFFLE